MSPLLSDAVAVSSCRSWERRAMSVERLEDARPTTRQRGNRTSMTTPGRLVVARRVLECIAHPLAFTEGAVAGRHGRGKNAGSGARLARVLVLGGFGRRVWLFNITFHDLLLLMMMMN